jgi:membrane-associated phospholipid phosphatase
MRRALALLCAFAGFAVLVAAGAFTWLDQFAVDRLMPGLDPGSGSQPGLLDALLPVAGADSGWEVAADLWLFPASVGLSTLLVGACAVTLWRRGRHRAAVLWPAALVLGTAIEVVLKETLVKPSVFADGLRIGQFDVSLPSGHTIRAVVVAAVVSTTWTRVAPYATAWAASVLVVLVVAGWHTPTDVVAGLLLAAALVLAAHDLERRGVDRGPLGAAPVDDREPPAVQSQPTHGLRP